MVVSALCDCTIGLALEPLILEGVAVLGFIVSTHPCPHNVSALLRLHRKVVAGFESIQWP